jgi:hypothetical protein
MLEAKCASCDGRGSVEQNDHIYFGSNGELETCSECSGCGRTTILMDFVGPIAGVFGFAATFCLILAGLNVLVLAWVPVLILLTITAILLLVGLSLGVLYRAELNRLHRRIAASSTPR